ncbi:MAG: 50S ribosomal protein L25 [Candidatus Omnitrophica bacterium]|jgi:large subunit ribosomal protein L25|nr:50S ribosomal protein L25 [Candidatus Omnitrophota bacterium]MDD5660646.1 50S ribosomal protein L25 [Candidatus Omnitrophota bacterium]
MEEIFLEAELRDGTGRAKAKDLRDNGYLPGVVYFHGKDALSVKIPRGALLKLVHQYRLENTIINLKIKGDKKASGRPCIVKEMQHDPVHEDIIHVDFNEISLTESIKVNVPVAVKGEAIGVKQEGGSLEHLLWEVEVECLPTNIPKNIEVDITALKMGEAIHIKDMVFPAGTKPLNDPAAIVLHVIAPMKEEAPAEAVEGEDKQEPEVIKEKKEVPGEAAPAQDTKEKDKK